MSIADAISRIRSDRGRVRATVRVNPRPVLSLDCRDGAHAACAACDCRCHWTIRTDLPLAA